MPASAALAPRAAPQQARSRATHERILALSAELLDDMGVEAFNTNMLAARAGLSPRAIYRYFPNKWAIVLALAERARLLEREWIGDLAALAPGDDWRRALDRAIFDYHAAASRQTGYRALRAAVESVPALRALNAAENAAVQRDLKTGLRALGARGSDAEIEALCCVVLEASNRILDIALQADAAQAPVLLAILHRMIADLLARYLD